MISPILCDLEDIIRRGVSRAYPNPENRIRYEIPEHLPLIMADPQRLEVVIRNLVENSAKYADSDLPIIVRVHLLDDQIVIKIEDYGPGIPSNSEKDVFQSRKPALSTKKKYDLASG